jgi:HEPN domain-containing protein
MNRQDFRRLAEHRVQDAEVLLAGRRYAAAYYLCGYAMECALKTLNATQTKPYERSKKKG